MWLEEYFYWWGIVIHVVMAISLITGMFFSASSWVEERRYWKGRESSDGSDEQGDTPKEEIGERYRQY